MENKDIFLKVGVDYHDEDIPIISNGKHYFALGDYINGIYVNCIKVADKHGCCKDNDSYSEDFIAVYEDSKLIGYKIV